MKIRFITKPLIPGLISVSTMICAMASATEYSAATITTTAPTPLSGDMVWGGEGDWLLSNGVVCAVVSDVDHEGELASTGGYLTDFGYCDKPGEGLGQLYFTLNFSGKATPAVTKIQSSSDAQSAVIQAQFEYPGVTMGASYSFSDDAKNRLLLKVELEKNGTDEEFDVSTLTLVNLNRGNKVFTGSLDGKGPAPGFKHLPLPVGLWDELDGLVGSDIIVSLPDSEQNQMVYGQRLLQAYSLNPEGEKTLLPTFVGVTDSIAAAVTFTDTFVFDEQGRYLDILKLLESQLLDLPEGHRLVVEQEISFAHGRDVAAIVNQYWAGEPKLSGNVGRANATVFLYREDGGLANQAFTGEDGGFVLRAPQGSYRLQVEASGSNIFEQSIELNADINIGTPKLSQVATLILPRDETMRLSFFPLDGQALDFIRQPFGFEANGKVKPAVIDVMLAQTPADTRMLNLAPGAYEVIASRGPEYSAHSIELKLEAGKQSTLDIPSPKRLFTTPGYVAADLHTHAAPSFDNNYPQHQRLKSYVAQGGEVLVATEHETIYSYVDDIARLGLSTRLATVTGTEVTSLVSSEIAPNTIGHANIFPLTVKKGLYRNGAVAHENRRWRDVIADVKADAPEALLHLNHPRVIYSPGVEPEEGSQQFNEGYLSHLLGDEPYDSGQPLSAEPNKSLIEADPKTGVRDIDFDAIELINGTGVGLNSYIELRKDWFSFLRQGIKMVGTATSDSHGQHFGEVVLEPRTLVALEDDNMASFDEAKFIKAIKSGNVYGTTGPLLDIKLQANTQVAKMGETLKAANANLSLRVDAAPWMNIDTLKVYVNGLLRFEMPIQAGQENLLPLEFNKDSFVTVEVSGQRSGLFAKIVPKIPPFAFSNPIYVDADQDGKWSAPGL